MKRTPDAQSACGYRYAKVKDERIDALNKAYAEAPDKLSEVTKQAEALRAALYAEAKHDRGEGEAVFHSDNLKLLDKFWKKYVLTKRPHIDANTAFCEYRRAVEALGQLPLLTAPIPEMQRQIGRNLRGNSQRRVILRLRTILRFFKREEDAKLLVLDHEDEPKVAYLSRADYLLMRSRVKKHEHRVVLDCLVYMGMRTGELFASKKEDLIGQTLLVRWQISRNLEQRGTKNRKTRKTYVFDEGLTALTEWYALSEAAKTKLRNRQWSVVVKSACRRSFPIGGKDNPPENRDKWLCAHDLRHCFAIWLLEENISLHNVARCIGDSVSVCEKHYTGFILTDDAMDKMVSSIKGNSARAAS